MKAIWNGTVVADSDDTVVFDGEHYFPADSVKREYLASSNHRSSSWKGQAVWHSLLVNGDLHPEAAWTYPEPSEAAAAIKGRIAFGKGVRIE
jgi:uncharacterized protein (DUF427 family)